MNLVHAKPLSHMEYKNDKIKGNISQTPHILISDVLLSYKSQLKAIVVYSPAVILLWDCV